MSVIYQTYIFFKRFTERVRQNIRHSGQRASTEVGFEALSNLHDCDSSLFKRLVQD